MMPMTRGNIEILLDSPDERDYVVSAFADLSAQDGFRDFFDREFRNQAREAGAALSEAEARKALEENFEGGPGWTSDRCSSSWSFGVGSTS